MILALVAAVQILGFSSGDKSVAYIETGTNPGSGAAFAKLHVVDVAKGADKVTAFDGDDSEAKALKAAGGGWAKPKTIEHDERGELSDHTGAPIGTLELTTRKAKASGCDEPFDPLLVKLVMHFMDDDKPATVGAEKTPPKARACASSCMLDKVYAHGKAALVLIKCVTPCF